LRRADLVRNPYLGTTVDLELSVVSKETGRELRQARFLMLTHRRGSTLLLLSGEDRSREGRTTPGALLIADDTYRLLLPHAERPVELALRHVVKGDLSHAGFLRVNLRERFEARHDGEETVEGVPCWRLELEPNSSSGFGVAAETLPFQRVRYWIARHGALPIRIDFLGDAGEAIKTVRFTAYQDTGVGRRPARIEIEDAGRPDEKATLTLGEPAGVPTSGLAFDDADLLALRTAARRLAAESDRPVGGGSLVRALLIAARERETSR